MKTVERDGAMSIVYLLSAGSCIRKHNGRLDIYAPSGEWVDSQVASEVESLVISGWCQVGSQDWVLS